MAVVHFLASLSQPSLIGSSLGVQGRTQVAFPKVGQNDHDHLASHFGAASNLDGNVGGGPRANACENTFFLGQTAGHDESVRVPDQKHLVNDVEIQNVGDEARPNTLNPVSAWGRR